MEGRRLAVHPYASNKEVASKRRRFDAHISGCADCQPALCFQAQTLWRDVCLTALKAHSEGATDDQT